MHSAMKGVLAVVAYAGIHSGLASRPAKAAAGRLLGERLRNGLYRPFFNLQAVGLFAMLAWYLHRLPNGVVYDVRGRGRVALRLGQLFSLGLLLSAARQVGIARLSGFANLRELFAGKTPRPEPEAQHPDFPLAQSPRLFAVSRHPINLFSIPLLWLNPRMTRNALLFTILATVYFYVGSMHEEARLRRRYGEAYEAYRRSGAPFFVPVPTAGRLSALYSPV